MKMKLIPAAILAALSMAGAAQAQVAVYGLIDAGFAHTESTGATASTDAIAYSNNSTTKFGIKGSADAGSGIKANFQLESGKAAAPKSAATGIFDRQAWAGLSGSFGEVRFGVQDSVAFKTMIGYDLNGASNDTMAAGGVLNTLGQNSNVGIAGKDLFNYISPNMGGFQATVSFAPRGNNVDATNGTGNAAVGLSYNKGPLSVGYVYEGSSNSSAAVQASNAYSALGGSYNFGIVTLAAELVNGGTNQRGTQIGLSVPVAGATVGVQYAKNTDTNENGTEFFVNKEVLKNTIAYAEYGFQNKTPATPVKNTSYSVGLMFVF